jgi:hypothetical protein
LLCPTNSLKVSSLREDSTPLAFDDAASCDHGSLTVRNLSRKARTVGNRTNTDVEVVAPTMRNRTFRVDPKEPIEAV